MTIWLRQGQGLTTSSYYPANICTTCGVFVSEPYWSKHVEYHDHVYSRATKQVLNELIRDQMCIRDRRQLDANLFGRSTFRGQRQSVWLRYFTAVPRILHWRGSELSLTNGGNQCDAVGPYGVHCDRGSSPHVVHSYELDGAYVTWVDW